MSNINRFIRSFGLDNSFSKVFGISGNVTPPNPIPGQPQNLAADSVTEDSANLTWEAPITGDAPDYYQLQVRLNGESDWLSPLLDDTTTDLFYSLSGLSENTSYDVRVRANNSYGDGPWLEIDNLFITDGLQPPNTPTDLFLIGVTEDSGSFSWAAPVGGGLVDSYEWQVQLTGGDWSILADFGSTTITDGDANGLDAETTYDVRVRAVNSAGNSPWLTEIAFFITSPPPPEEPPVNIDLPEISGTPEEGEELTTTNGLWSGTPVINYFYQWKRYDTSGVFIEDITGETTNNYIITEDDVGFKIGVTVTATNDYGSDSANSALTDEVQAAEAFTPTDIAGLRVWMDGADNSTALNASALPAGDGEAVATWLDKSGNNYHVTQATGSARPSYETGEQAGLPVLRHDGGDGLTNASITMPNNESTWFAVAQVTSKTAYGHFFSYGGTGSGSVGLRQVALTGRLSFLNAVSNTGAGATAVSTPAGATADLQGQGFQIHTGQQDVTSFSLYQGSDLMDSRSEPGFSLASSGTFVAGWRMDAQGPMNGDLAELIVYDTALSPTDLQRVWDYLSAKWGITL